MTPLELLEAELNKWKRALEKLEEMFKNNNIVKSTYDERKANLLPKISTYKYAINVLVTYM